MFSLRSTLAIAFLGLTFSTGIFANEWMNVGPIQSGDMRAFIDYQVKFSVPAGDVWNGRPPQGPASYQYDTSPLWVNVLRENLSATDRVFVQIISYERGCYRGDCSNLQQRISERDLDFAEYGRFTGQMQPVNLSYQLNDGYALSHRRPYRYELVVWINGSLYKDPSGRNLQFNMPVSLR
jgi:hypothetical protein